MKYTLEQAQEEAFLIQKAAQEHANSFREWWQVLFSLNKELQWENYEFWQKELFTSSDSESDSGNV